ncbi:MAG: glycogen debranching protein GlgX [Acidobacteriota bacterium]
MSAAIASAPVYKTSAGRPHPFGATVTAGGVNFSLFSQYATGVELLLFERHDSLQPFQTIAFDAFVNKTFHIWHVYVEGLRACAHYAYRVDGPANPEAGHRFNRNKVLIDPYARGNTDVLWDRARACDASDNVEASLRSVVIDPSGYDWEGDRPLGRPIADSIIYEMHVRGFTRSPSSGVTFPGTFAGVVAKIPYLQQLGVTAVELMPVFDFDETDVLRTVDSMPLTNFWGYSTYGFFAPQSAYCVSPEDGRHLNEFRDMVKALHRAGIEVILDVVFNHTGEGDDRGPVYEFKGIDNRTYYYLAPWDPRCYLDYAGAGNTFNANHPIAEKLILDSLRYWVRETHVDGFRFDEGSVLSRGEDGAPLEHPPVVWQIELDEELADTKVIAEAWDAAGLYQIGHFPGDRWSEWNGRYRDDIRRFVRGDPGLVGVASARIAGSADLYQERGARPINSVNFVAAHDGFTMNDLVSYNTKHNEKNGEGNRDGVDDNASWNYGVEGPSEHAAIEALRERQIRNFAAILMLSRGVPMFVAGDECRRTQRGNNNAYCQDNEISWFDWALPESNGGLLRFWRRMIAFRKAHPTLRRGFFYGSEVNGRGLPEIAWHGTKLNAPGWNDASARALAFTAAGFNGDADLHVMMNMYWEKLEFETPAGRWVLAVDTAQPSPRDIAEPGEEAPFSGAAYPVEGRSVVVLISR